MFSSATPTAAVQNDGAAMCRKQEIVVTELYLGSAPRSKRGFASMDPERQRAIASLGGQAAHRTGNAHQFNSEEARLAGKKRHEKRKTRDDSSAVGDAGP